MNHQIKHIVVGATINEFNNVISQIPKKDHNDVNFVWTMEELQQLTKCCTNQLSAIKAQFRLNKETTFMINECYKAYICGIAF